MKNLLFIVALSFILSACMVTDGVSTTGKSVSSSFDTTTDTTSSSSNDKDKNWEYDEGQAEE